MPIPTITLAFTCISCNNHQEQDARHLEFKETMGNFDHPSYIIYDVVCIHCYKRQKVRLARD